MNEKETAEIIKKDLILAMQEDNQLYGFSIPLNHEIIENLNIDILIKEFKKIDLFADYQKNVKYHRYSKQQKNCLMVSTISFNN